MHGVNYRDAYVELAFIDFRDLGDAELFDCLMDLIGMEKPYGSFIFGEFDMIEQAALKLRIPRAKYGAKTPKDAIRRISIVIKLLQKHGGG